MADIKTKDNIKGTIKTIDKTAIARQRMFKRKKKRNILPTLRKIVRRNMPLTVLRAVLTVLLTKLLINSISRDEKALKRRSRIFQRQRTESGSLRKSGRRKL